MSPNVISNTKEIYGQQGNLQRDQMFNETSCMIFFAMLLYGNKIFQPC
jgi:hypothetical protein